MKIPGARKDPKAQAGIDMFKEEARRWRGWSRVRGAVQKMGALGHFLRWMKSHWRD